MFNLFHMMHRVFMLFLGLIYTTISAQETNLFSLKKKIYDRLIDDFTTTISPKSSYEVWIDPITYQFENIEMNEFGISLKQSVLLKDDKYCDNQIIIYCKDKIELDSFQLSIITQPGHDDLYSVYYLVYQPLDAWYSIILHLNEQRYLQSYNKISTVYFPTKKIEVKNNKVTIKQELVTVNLTKDFEIFEINKRSF
ncbi:MULTISPECIES: hypothetical protein [Weeksella]|uniref:hypothetical protein n=1 Tax=Weeksella TaxID=1013 RepID=UPI00114D1A5B|nr:MULTISPECIES: hypothetical protein [Weeksella]MDK7375847.1 hypothetical protein [Weeksella virosa]